MTGTTTYPNAPDLSPEDYLVVGLATCFIKEDGEVHQVKIVEPIPSAALEALVKGIPTSYEVALATTLGVVLDGTTAKIPDSFLVQTGESNGGLPLQLCADFADRAVAAARTYKRRPVSQSLIPLGSDYRDFKYSLDRKRLLNAENIVRNEDNVKQHEWTHKVL
ncbi:hypothetical protein [[Phormidium] sp. ETS-05]|uniref:hypothetical protein n=1 Tax=[Phormidium] sp. ETS-05 TaxID=222819 RepID=UPI0018EF269B|nr:hypothetical protein [[Phormidium] sp. ETS-05]